MVIAKFRATLGAVAGARQGGGETSAPEWIKPAFTGSFAGMTRSLRDRVRAAACPGPYRKQ
jgi:hypothetical protein